MPGLNEACVSGAHAGCADITCRCRCHPWTQELIKWSAPPPSALTTTHVGMPVEQAPEAANICGICNRRWRPTDFFCRKDGSKLLVGRVCIECGAVGEPEDVHCWRCGIRIGEKRPVQLKETPV